MSVSTLELERRIAALENRLGARFTWARGQTQPSVGPHGIMFWEDTLGDRAKMLMRRGLRIYVFESHEAGDAPPLITPATVLPTQVGTGLGAVGAVTGKYALEDHRHQLDPDGLVLVIGANAVSLNASGLPGDGAYFVDPPGLGGATLITGSGAIFSLPYFDTTTALTESGFSYDPNAGTPIAGITAFQTFIGKANVTPELLFGKDVTNALKVSRNEATGVVTLTTTGALVGAFATERDLKFTTLGRGIYLKEGSNAVSGIAPLVAGVAVVLTNKVTANSRIYLTRQTIAGTLGTSVDVTARAPGVSFTMTSNGSILDTSTVAWFIIEPSS